MSNINVQVGKQVDKKIEATGITKRAVSEKSGMPYSSLNSKLKGFRSFNIDEILAIAEAIGEPPSELLPEELKTSPALADGGAR